MAKARKDDRGRALRKGEVQRASDKRYMYTYTDPLGRRKFIYAYNFTVIFDLSVITFIFTEELLCFRYISQWSRPRKKKTW